MFTLLLILALTLGLTVWGFVRWSVMIGQPDEWLLRVRNGRLVDAGIGIALWRLPGDSVVRFSSTIQRVKFEVEARSQEQLPLTASGFVLWSVRGEADAPFVAFRTLGIANLDRRPSGLLSNKHLLTTNQYHAFQALVGAELQRVTAQLSFEVCLREPARLAEAVQAGLEKVTQAMGLKIDRTELLQVRPSDGTLLSDLGAATEQAVREEAAQARRASAERIRLAQIGSETTLAHREAEAKQARELANEAVTRAIFEAQKQREDLELEARLARRRRDAEAERDVMLLINAAEETKSGAVRSHELARLSTQKVTEVLGRWPIHDAKWVSVGDNPLSSVAHMVASVRELIDHS